MKCSLPIVLTALVGVLILLVTSPAIAACDVEDVVEMVEDDLSRSEIRKECDRKVNVDGCSLTKTMRLARDGYDVDEIYEACEGRGTSRNPDGGRRARYCSTPYGTCVITMGRVYVGEPCFCTGYYGTAWGVGR